MTGMFGLTYKDFDSEKSTVSVRTVAVTAANLDEVNTRMLTLQGAIANIALGVQCGVRKSWEHDSSNPVPTVNPLSQRETKWLVRYSDVVTGDMYVSEIPCADLSLLDASSPDPNTRKSLPISAGVGLAFKNAFEALMISPTGGDVTVQSVIHVGRAL